MVNASGTQTCVHPHASCPLYHCAADADNIAYHSAYHGKVITVHYVRLRQATELGVHYA